MALEILYTPIFDALFLVGYCSGYKIGVSGCVRRVTEICFVCTSTHCVAGVIN